MNIRTQITLIVTAGALILASSCGTPESSTIAESATPASTAIEAQACEESSFVGADGKPVDWAATARLFDADGPFALPEQPEWVPVEAYCSTILGALAADPPAPEGETPVDRGTNRFVLGAAAKSPSELKFGNSVAIALYPASIHTLYDSAGTEVVGFLAPGLGEVDVSRYETAADIADAPEVHAAVKQLIEQCEQTECELMATAAIDSGNTAIFGQPAP